MKANDIVKVEPHPNPNIVERLVPIYDQRNGAHYSVVVYVDIVAVGRALARKAMDSKAKKARLIDGAVTVRVQK